MYLEEDNNIKLSTFGDSGGTASRKGGKIGQVVLKGIEDFVRKGIVVLPERIKPDWLKNHYEPAKSENIRAIDVLAVPAFCEANGRQQFAEVKVIEVEEFSEETKDEILMEAVRTHTKATRDPYHSGICPDQTFIVLADREEKGYRMRFKYQKGHRRPQNGQGSEFWMVFNRRQGGAFIRKKIYEVFCTWLEKRCMAIKAASERKGFTLFGPIDKCVKFVSALARSLQKLADRISYVTKEEKRAVRESWTLIKKAKRLGLKFGRREDRGEVWVPPEEWSYPDVVWKRLCGGADIQGVDLLRSDLEALLNARPTTSVR